jgi:hypothetical protein
MKKSSLPFVILHQSRDLTLWIPNYWCLYFSNSLQLYMYALYILLQRGGGGGINTETGPCRWGEWKIWDSRIWSWAPWDSDSTKIVLESKCKLQTRLLVREGAPHQQTRNCLRIIFRKELVTGLRWVPETKTDWPTDSVVTQLWLWL